MLRRPTNICIRSFLGIQCPIPRGYSCLSVKTRASSVKFHRLPLTLQGLKACTTVSIPDFDSLIIWGRSNIWTRANGWPKTSRVWTQTPLLASHILIELVFSDEETIYVLSASENKTIGIAQPSWISRVWRQAPLLASQTLRVSSVHAEVMRVPSEEKATKETIFVWPSRVWRQAPYSGSMTGFVVIQCGSWFLKRCRIKLPIELKISAE